MPSVQRFLGGERNLVRAAVVSASSVRAASAIERVQTRRQGSGLVRLLGSYSGHEATQIEVQISALGASARASTPQLSGVGNGSLQVLTVDAAAPLQELELTLTDLGIPTAAASLDVRQVQLRARAAGAAGNQIRLAVRPVLERVPTRWALLSDWSAQEAFKVGEQWDFGALALSAREELDAASPRLQFGNDPQVYRPWRRYKDGQWQFGLSPQLVRSVSAGAPVYAVSGGYVVTVTDGVSSEVHGDTSQGATEIVSFHDLLVSLSGSALVQVAGVVALDRSVGGQASIDVPLRTSSWLLAQSGKVRLQDVTVPEDAPTQSVTLRCINAEVVGRERFSVTGDVSGVLAQATTGVPYASAALNFTVPRIDLPHEPGGNWSFAYAPTTRTSAQGLPGVCVRPFKFGRNATPRSVTLVYKKRPPADCNCKSAPTVVLSDHCLGLAKGDGQMALDPEYQSRLTALYEWRADFVQANVALEQNSSAGFSFIRADAREIEMVNAATAELASALAEVYEAQSARDQWDIEMAGVAALLAPYATLQGSVASALRAVRWQRAAFLSEDVYVLPLVRNGKLYRVAIGNGTTGWDEPDWSQSPYVDDGEVRYVPEVYWSANTAYVQGQSVEPGDGYRYVVKVPGISGASEATWGYTLIVDGTVQWERASVATGSQINLAPDVSVTLYEWGGSWSYLLTRTRNGVTRNELVLAYQGEAERDKQEFTLRANTEATLENFILRVRSRMDYVRTIAGIVPKSESGSTDAGSCWTDAEDPYWWVDESGYYLPAFTNCAYVSARRDAASGKAYSTMEFGFGLAVACPERLLEGDSVTIRIEQVDGARPYSVGDEVIVQTIGAGPAWLTGGVDGTDELTWRVRGSVSGTLPDYVVPTNASAPLYSAAGVQLSLQLAGIAFALGDVFTFAVEAGQWRWRKAGGSWSALQDIPADAALPLTDGLSVEFAAGAAPSFVAGDSYLFAVHQPYAPSHVRDALPSAWAWEGADAQLEIDFGVVRELGALALARCVLPAGASLTVAHSQDAVLWSMPLALAVPDPQSGVCVQMFEATLWARFVRIEVQTALGGSIGHVWAGLPLATRLHASSVRRKRRWASTRAALPNAGAQYGGSGDGWQFTWDSALGSDEVSALCAMLDWAQQRDEPLIVLAHYRHPEDATLVRCLADSLEVTDVFEYQPDNAAQRLLSATLELDPVFA